MTKWFTILLVFVLVDSSNSFESVRIAVLVSNNGSKVKVISRYTSKSLGEDDIDIYVRVCRKFAMRTNIQGPRVHNLNRERMQLVVVDFDRLSIYGVTKELMVAVGKEPMLLSDWVKENRLSEHTVTPEKKSDP